MKFSNFVMIMDRALKFWAYVYYWLVCDNVASNAALHSKNEEEEEEYIV